MAALCIVEDPASGGMYSRVIAPHASPVFDSVGYVATAPLQGLEDHRHIDMEHPVEGYSHFLLVGSPEFLAKQPTPAGWVYGAYALADTQFIPVEQTGWVDRVSRIAVPSPMTGGALQLACGKDVAWKEVRPWGFPIQPRRAISRTEIRQLLVPGWTHEAPVVLAYAEFADVMCAMLARTKNVNLLLLGEPDDRQAVRLDMNGLTEDRVQFTTSQLAWDAADVFVALNPFTAWPWDLVYALSRPLPVLAIKTHVYETFVDGIGCVGQIPAFDPIMLGQRLGYQANSADIANALASFVADPTNLHARARIAGQAFAEHTQERFAKLLITTLFAA